ncbi:MAG: YceI family protein [Verrucomicrobiae bacterium]|nr:YceI family protein [Verrucomicrobiae bacterium]
MKKLLVIAVVTAAVLLGVAGAYFAYQSHVNKQQLAKSGQGMLVTDTGAVAQPPAQPAGPVRTFKLSDKSVIKWTGYKKVGRHSGWFILFEGVGKMPDNNLEQATIEVSIETDSVETDDPTGILTKVMKNESFFHCEKFPTSTFKSVSIAKADGPDKYTVTGDLQLRGITKRIAFPATITVSGDTVRLEADFKVNRRWWDIIWQGTGDSFLEDDVRIELKAEAKEVK